MPVWREVDSSSSSDEEDGPIKPNKLYLMDCSYLQSWEVQRLDLSAAQREYLDCDGFFRRVTGFWAELC